MSGRTARRIALAPVMLALACLSAALSCGGRLERLGLWMWAEGWLLWCEEQT